MIPNKKSHNNSAHSKHSNHKSRLESEKEYIEKHFKTYDTSMFDRCKEIIEKEKLFDKLPPEIQQIASQAACVNTNFHGKGPSGIVAAELRQKKLEVILFQQHMELQAQLEQQRLQEMGNENMLNSNTSVGSSGSTKDIKNMNDLQDYYKKHIKGNLSNGSINNNDNSGEQRESPILNYTQNLIHSNYASNMTDKNKKSPKTTNQPYCASISPLLKTPVMKPPQVTTHSPPLVYTENTVKNPSIRSKQSESQLEIQELTMALKNLPPIPDSPTLSGNAPNTTQPPATKVYYNKSPKLESPYSRYQPSQQQPMGNKTPTLDFPMFLTNNDQDGIPPLNGQEFNNPGYYIGRSNSPPIVDTPPRTASVGVLREIIPNPYKKKNTR